MPGAAGKVHPVQPGSAQSQSSGEKTQVVLWHTYTDAHEEALLKVVDSFNTSQDEYEVVLNSSHIANSTAKLRQAVQHGTGPDR